MIHRFISRLGFGLALTVLFLAHAHAQATGAIAFASYTGDTAPAGVSNTPIKFASADGTASGTVSLAGSGAEAAGAASITSMQGSAPVGDTTYTTSVTGQLAGYSGSIQVSCDDQCAVSLNGTVIGTTATADWDSVETFAIPATALVNGVNTLSIKVTNTLGETSLSFSATATPAAAAVPPPPVATPGPSALTGCEVLPFYPIPAVPSTPFNCSLPAGALKVGDDGTVVTILTVASPVELIYCATPSGAAAPSCNRPIFFGANDPFWIGPTALLGGPRVPIGANQIQPLGSLYIVPGAGPVTLTTATPSPLVTIPAAAPN